MEERLPPVQAALVGFLGLAVEAEEQGLSISRPRIRMIFSRSSSRGWAVEDSRWQWTTMCLLEWAGEEGLEEGALPWVEWVEWAGCLEWEAWVGSAWVPNPLLRNLKSLLDHYKFLSKSIAPCMIVAHSSLYTGTTKRLKITRRINDGSGNLKSAENVLEVTVKPGWKPGTKIRFPNAGDELVPGHAQTIAFVVEEKPHPLFKRDGDDLSCEIEISFVEAFAGFTREIKTLDGRTLKVTGSSGDVVQPGQVKLYAREGMPNQRTGGKGNLRVKINVKFPKTATRDQVEGIKRLFG